MRSIVFGLALVLCACGGSKASSGGGACVAPSGVWSIALDSPSCGKQTLHEDFTQVSAADACKLVSQSFDTAACVYMQQAQCTGYVGTLSFQLDKAGAKLSGTVTIEKSDGTTCDFDATGSKP